MDPNEVSIQKIVDARVTIADRQYDLVLEPDEAAAMCKDQWYLYCKQAEEQKEAKKSLERLAIEDERESDARHELTALQQSKEFYANLYDADHNLRNVAKRLRVMGPKYASLEKTIQSCLKLLAPYL